VSVQATDSSGYKLHYRWKSTDGTIKNVDAPSTTWTLPAGPGIHFAYVLVSNNHGGYTERRILVNTDTIGSELPEQESYSRLVAPPSPAQVGDYFRNWETGGETQQGSPIRHEVYVPNLLAYAQDPVSGNVFPPSGYVKSNVRGEVVIPGVPSSTVASPYYNLMCSEDDGVTFAYCGSNAQLNFATSGYIPNGCCGLNDYVGRLQLADGTPCGTQNEFFGVRVSPAAMLVDASNTVVSGPVTVNELGDYELLYSPTATAVLLVCESSQQTVPLSGSSDAGLTTLTASSPTVVTMTAALHGAPLVAPVAKFLPPPSGFPSDILQRADGFLTEKGIDSRVGACQYYKAVGAVKGCTSDGSFIGAVTFQDWRHQVKIGKFAVHGVPTYTAAYINKVDLNLARVQESISYGPNQTAGVVCNHLGPPADTPDDLMNPATADIDTAVANAVNNKNLVACVAMDYTISNGVNNNQPFIRFMIFGPSGQLLPSVNLDGRREKFVPGTCVVCHGGDHYAGKFPEDGSGFANVGGHFLPYDAGNFEFASTGAFAKSNQQLALYNLNQNVRNAGATPAENDLITGWYAGQSPTSPVLNESYTPDSWNAAGVSDPTAVPFYQNVLARSCRTCHTAMVEPYNFDHYANVAPFSQTAVFADTGFDIGINICGGSAGFLRDHMMPNSLITFNRLWLSSGSVPNPPVPNQPALLTNFYGSDTAFDGSCPGPVGILP
jgi:hypothetical protein